MQTVTPLTHARLPRFTRPQAALSRVLCESAIGVRPQLWASQKMQRPVRVTLTCQLGELSLRLDAQQHPALESIAHDADATRRVALANLYLAGILQAWTARGLAGLVISEISQADAASSGGLSINSGGFVCVVDDITAGLLQGWPEIQCAAPARLMAPGRLRLASRRLSQQQISTLQLHDVVLGWGLSTAAFEHSSAQLFWGSSGATQLGAPVWVEGQRLTLQGPGSMSDEHFDFSSEPVAFDDARYAVDEYAPEPIHSADTADVPYQPQYEEPAQSAPAARSGTTPLAALNLPVHLELSTLNLPVATLETLDAGYVLELPQSLAQAEIRLVTCGQTFALGQLVAIGDALGVQITKVYGHHEFQS